MSGYNNPHDIHHGNRYQLSGVVDPTVTAVFATQGTIYQKLTAPTGLYQKQDNGLTTNWVAIGGGSSLNFTVDGPSQSVIQNDVANNVATGLFSKAEGELCSATHQGACVSGKYAVSRHAYDHVHGIDVNRCHRRAFLTGALTSAVNPIPIFLPGGGHWSLPPNRRAEVRLMVIARGVSAGVINETLAQTYIISLANNGAGISVLYNLLQHDTKTAGAATWTFNGAPVGNELQFNVTQTINQTTHWLAMLETLEV